MKYRTVIRRLILAAVSIGLWLAFDIRVNQKSLDSFGGMTWTEVKLEKAWDGKPIIELQWRTSDSQCYEAGTIFSAYIYGDPWHRFGHDELCAAYFEHGWSGYWFDPLSPTPANHWDHR